LCMMVALTNRRVPAFSENEASLFGGGVLDLLRALEQDLAAPRGPCIPGGT